jgi:hypothetical protein
MVKRYIGLVLGLVLVIVVTAAVIAAKPAGVTPDGKSSDRPDLRPATPATSVIYENDKMKMVIPEGWLATEAVKPVYEGTSTVPTYVANPAAVNITNGLWILYVNVDASQASGVEGGRFAEIAMGAPSVDEVVTEQPNECGVATSVKAFDNFTRVDYTINMTQATEICKAPTNGKTVWFFSYLTSPGNGFFNDYILGQNPGLVVTMAYNTSALSASPAVNYLPEAGSDELETMLEQMTDIADSLQIKNR